MDRTDLIVQNTLRPTDELRTPLTLVIGPISDILDSSHEHLTASVRDRLKVVKVGVAARRPEPRVPNAHATSVRSQRSSQRLINLVNQLLDLSRFEAGRMVARFRPVRLAQTVADVASLFRSSLTKASALRASPEGSPLIRP